MDNSLGQCKNDCGRYASYANTMECRACYKKRRRRNLKPEPVEGMAIKKYNFNRGKYSPRSDGRQSSYTKWLIAETRKHFLEDTGYLQDIITDAIQTKARIEGLMEKHGMTQLQAMDLDSLDGKERQQYLYHHRKNNAQV